jgi:hypothetical protein
LRLQARVVPAPGWCVSTIARVPELADAVAALRLDGYRYPAESLHISLMGCTQREAERPSLERARRIADAARPVLTGPAAEVEVGRLNVLGAQAFLEVLTDSPRWAELRLAVADAAEAIGEQPIGYADAEPMHLSVARVDTLPDLDQRVDRRITLDRIEVVITDFVVTPETLTVVDLIRI